MVTLVSEDAVAISEEAERKHIPNRIQSLTGFAGKSYNIISHVNTSVEVKKGGSDSPASFL
jgi:hypothetical protein